MRAKNYLNNKNFYINFILKWICVRDFPVCCLLVHKSEFVFVDRIELEVGYQQILSFQHFKTALEVNFNQKRIYFGSREFYTNCHC